MNKEFFNPTLLNTLIALGFAIMISYVDLHNDEVQPAVLLLLIFSFILGYRHPQMAWLYSLILGLSVISGYLISKGINFKPTGTPDNIFSTLIALIPSFIGGYIGVIVKSFFRKVMSNSI